ncbi:ABC transporter permease [Clostridium butyricum]|jgi:ABC-2 type transport system permease protein|uniref:ABC transporter permease n=1 Tax=Clostridium butyricum TaxID=1492 RepID=A0A512TJQ4_CLOBU|nr:ABC-2 family transporter protein [Clostridium butyricum]MBZ0313977.1 ABC-2 family transporter protein [Clostridium butyricum]NAS16367.1 hypothetical protein [Clostridium butyricum]NOW24362.1 ABC-2 type transport system permease protein [Clostridium butyricum]GEQ20492.1 hypothetical protein CBU02nite_09980 [Clostridium butyricum]
MKKSLSIKSYFTFTKNVFQRNIAYKANTIMFVLGDTMILAVTYYLWKAIYSSSSQGTLNGFSYNDMIVYVLLSFITQGLIGTEVGNTISREVRNGSIASNLIKPISYEKRMLFEGFGGMLYGFILVFIIGFTAVLIIAMKTQIGLTIPNVIMYFLSVILSYFINFYYSYSMGLLTFKITNMWGVNQIMQAVTALFSGALVPITFFPKVVQNIFDFFPFKSIIYTPCMIFENKLSSYEICIAFGRQIFWVIAMMIIGKVMYKALVKNLTILGG